jgi:SAM-dependent methyltransferase
VKATSILLQTITSNGSQVFLGAPWIRTTLRVVPQNWKRRLALEYLAISPHYFSRTDGNCNFLRKEFLESELMRNKTSRRLLIEGLVQKHADPDSVVLDYGCGPGYLAAVASRYAKQVIACDISDGVLACANVLNPRHNVQYVKVSAEGGTGLSSRSVDLVYSFAVIQHVGDCAFASILAEFYRVTKPGATVLCHIVLNGAAGWRMEGDWKKDKTIRGRAKWLVGLHTFARSAQDAARFITNAGFSAPNISTICCRGLRDDLEGQPLFVFRKLGHGAE